MAEQVERLRELNNSTSSATFSLDDKTLYFASPPPLAMKKIKTRIQEFLTGFR